MTFGTTKARCCRETFRHGVMGVEYQTSVQMSKYDASKRTSGSFGRMRSYQASPRSGPSSDSPGSPGAVGRHET
jgi:hypothetical protein